MQARSGEAVRQLPQNRVSRRPHVPRNTRTMNISARNSVIMRAPGGSDHTENTTAMKMGWRGSRVERGTEDRLREAQDRRTDSPNLNHRDNGLKNDGRSPRGLRGDDEAADFRVFGDPGEEKKVGPKEC